MRRVVAFKRRLFGGIFLRGMRRGLGPLIRAGRRSMGRVLDRWVELVWTQYVSPGFYDRGVIGRGDGVFEGGRCRGVLGRFVRRCFALY